LLNRRELITGATGIAATSLLRWRPAYARDKKPNLLYILADDHAGYVLGADGNAMAITPNLDRLASEGTRFARHYCNAPVCTPSRQSFFTSQLPHASGVTVFETALAEDRATLAKHLAESGYRTAVFGKMHFNQAGRAGLHGFEVADTEDVVQRSWLTEVGPQPDFTDIP
jgi:arylsulfatase A-like enzyme